KTGYVPLFSAFKTPILPTELCLVFLWLLAHLCGVQFHGISVVLRLGIALLLLFVTNSINRGSGAHRDEGEARSIGSSKYKNLKLGKEEDEDQEAAIYTSSHHMLSLSRPPPHGGRHGSARTRAVTLGSLQSFLLAFESLPLG